jgi:hypothetical protein
MKTSSGLEVPPSLDRRLPAIGPGKAQETEAQVTAAGCDGMGAGGRMEEVDVTRRASRIEICICQRQDRTRALGWGVRFLELVQESSAKPRGFLVVATTARELLSRWQHFFSPPAARSCIAVAIPVSSWLFASPTRCPVLLFISPSSSSSPSSSHSSSSSSSSSLPSFYFVLYFSSRVARERHRDTAAHSSAEFSRQGPDFFGSGFFA